MDLTKRERIEGNKFFTHLTGKGFNATPAYKGGLFCSKWAMVKFDNGYRLEHIKWVIQHFTSEQVNQPVALFKLIQENIRLDRLNNGYEGCEEIFEWMCQPSMEKETLQKTFSLMRSTFRTKKEIQKAQKVYDAFSQKGFKNLLFSQRCGRDFI